MTHHGRSCSNSKRNVNPDRISSLPDDILHHILSFLPMKNAIHTSILSNRWKSLWTFNPNLDFPLDVNLNPEIQQPFIPIITRCLRLCHCPNINRLLINLFALQEDIPTHFDTWVKFAIARGVRELLLYIIRWEPFHLPESLYFHTPLTKLSVCSSIFNLPMEFKGFPFLKVLELHNVRVDDQTVETMLFTCPLLEELVLVNCNDLVNLNISCASAAAAAAAAPPHLSLKILKVAMCVHLIQLRVNAPNLVFFSYIQIRAALVICLENGKAAGNIILENVPHLREVDLSLFQHLNTHCVLEWAPLVTSMANVESLTVRSWFSQVIFARYCMPRTPHFAFINLKEFHWSGELVDRYEILAIVEFLGDCPLLQKLYINIENLGNQFSWYRDYYEMVQKRFPSSQGNVRIINDKEESYLRHLDYALHHLKTIEIVGFSGRKEEMELVGFLLDKSVVLDLLLLTYAREDEIEEFLPEWDLQQLLSCLPKRSTHAKIVLAEPPPKPASPPPHLYEGYSSDELEQ